MKTAFFTALILLVAPIQIALLGQVRIAGLSPDLALVVVCLIGLFRSEAETVTAGLVMGFAQDLFSAGALWSNLCLKPILGLMAWLAGRSLVNLTWAVVLALLLGLSLLSGLLMYLLMPFAGAEAGFFSSMSRIILPQACYDAMLGLAAWMLIRRVTAHHVSLTMFAR